MEACPVFYDLGGFQKQIGCVWSTGVGRVLTYEIDSSEGSGFKKTVVAVS